MFVAFAVKRYEKCLNAAAVVPWVAEQAACLLKLHLNP
jgi:hypothetical protein